MRRKFGNLDIIKIVAATLILFHHYQQLTDFKMGGSIEFYGGIFNFGYLVELFFIISGFLSTYTFKNIKFSDWMLTRIKRIFPYAFISVLFSLVIALIYYSISHKALFDINYNIPTIFTSLTLLHSGWIWEFSPAINNPTWYLCILILCYIIFFCLQKIFFKYEWLKRYGFFFAAIIAVGLYYICGHGISNIPFMRLSNCRGYGGFFIGCALCKLIENIKKKYIIVLNILLWILTVIGFAKIGYSNWYILTCCFFPAVVLFALLLPQVRSNAIKNAGAISFEVYLWHVPIYSLLLIIITVMQISITRSFFTMIAFCALVWIWSTMVFYLFEIRFSTKLNKKNN